MSGPAGAAVRAVALSAAALALQAGGAQADPSRPGAEQYAAVPAPGLSAPGRAVRPAPMPAPRPADLPVAFAAPAGPVPAPPISPMNPSRPMDSALVCMARTLYYEARGQGRRGLEAVAHVVLNRVAHRQFPRTICGVVTEGGKRGPCQFSWYCDGRSDRPRDMREYARVFAIAWEVLAGLTKDPTGGANMFHNTRVRPRWARVAEARGRIGAHLFYYLRRR